ncbi:FecCD family ABC transporter permease [Branchiibius cervicis]|uniref:FecCD family ABC transporter permease n=1 Tax=Branchiibius cervicis TaxID=908252 RepID=A0ABW2ANH3_9MICO
MTKRSSTAVMVSIVMLAVTVMLSLMLGAQALSPIEVVKAVFGGSTPEVQAIVQSRESRTLIGIIVGIAIALSGAAMQGITRNPLADPGLLGVDSGAALAVVIGLTTGVATSQLSFVLLALLGGAVAAVLVYLIASAGARGPDPITMTLAGAAMAAAASGLIAGLLITHQQALDVYRFWSVGSVGGRDLSVLPTTLPFLIVGLLIVLAGAPALNALALGDEMATTLGHNVLRARALIALGAVLLAAGATSIAGPIAFVGLVIPHFARILRGPDYRSILPLCIVLGPVLLLLADVIGRVIQPPVKCPPAS